MSSGAPGPPIRVATQPGFNSVTIDLTRLEGLNGNESEMLSRYLRMIQVQRQDFNGKVITGRVRTSDPLLPGDTVYVRDGDTRPDRASTTVTRQPRRARLAATAALFRDGWLCTGDLAYLVDGEPQGLNLLKWLSGAQPVNVY